MDKIVFLGTSAGSPSRTRNVTSHAMITKAGRVWMLDCGEGTQHRIIECKDVKSSRIDNILITHLHGDHCLGLPGLLSSLSLIGSRSKPVRVFGPQGIKLYLDTVLKVTESYITYPLEILELESDKPHQLGVFDSIKLSAYPLVHRVKCFGYVLEETSNPQKVDMEKAAALGITGKLVGQLVKSGSLTFENGTTVTYDQIRGDPKPLKKIVLLGDTSDSSAILEAGMSCDVLVHEATYDASKQEKAIAGGHSTSTMAGKFAHQIQAKKLILTHLSSRYNPQSFEETNGEESSSNKDEDKSEAFNLLKEAQAECPNTVVESANDFSTFTI